MLLVGAGLFASGLVSGSDEADGATDPTSVATTTAVDPSGLPYTGFAAEVTEGSEPSLSAIALVFPTGEEATLEFSSSLTSAVEAEVIAGFLLQEPFRAYLEVLQSEDPDLVARSECEAVQSASFGDTMECVPLVDETASTGNRIINWAHRSSITGETSPSGTVVVAGPNKETVIIEANDAALAEQVARALEFDQSANSQPMVSSRDPDVVLGDGFLSLIVPQSSLTRGNDLSIRIHPSCTPADQAYVSNSGQWICVDNHYLQISEEPFTGDLNTRAETVDLQVSS